MLDFDEVIPATYTIINLILLFYFMMHPGKIERLAIKASKGMRREVKYIRENARNFGKRSRPVKKPKEKWMEITEDHPKEYFEGIV